ncbi:hypothetical protein TcG_13020 [Trypanosoma cruzi]|nr:hypothetical protein TcG_13020 [Trypanosoma cruzi]
MRVTIVGQWFHGIYSVWQPKGFLLPAALLNRQLALSYAMSLVVQVTVTFASPLTPKMRRAVPLLLAVVELVVVVFSFLPQRLNFAVLLAVIFFFFTCFQFFILMLTLAILPFYFLWFFSWFMNCTLVFD